MSCCHRRSHCGHSCHGTTTTPTIPTPPPAPVRPRYCSFCKTAITPVTTLLVGTAAISDAVFVVMEGTKYKAKLFTDGEGKLYLTGCLKADVAYTVYPIILGDFEMSTASTPMRINHDCSVTFSDPPTFSAVPQVQP